MVACHLPLQELDLFMECIELKQSGQKGPVCLALERSILQKSKWTETETTTISDPDVVAAAPVAADLAEREEPDVLPAWRHADAVDAGPADDGDAPAALAAGAQQGERVVSDEDAVGPAERAH